VLLVVRLCCRGCQGVAGYCRILQCEKVADIPGNELKECGRSLKRAREREKERARNREQERERARVFSIHSCRMMI